MSLTDGRKYTTLHPVSLRNISLYFSI